MKSFIKRCGIAIDRCQHAALLKILDSQPKQQRSSLWKVYRWYCTKTEQSGGNVVSPSVEEIQAGTALSKQAICDARPRLEEIGLLRTHRVKGKGGFSEVTLLNAKNGGELSWNGIPVPPYFQSPRVLTHRKLYPQLHGTAVLIYDVMAAHFNRTGATKFSRAELLTLGKMTKPTLREALAGLQAHRLIGCNQDIELLHPETGEPMPEGATVENSEEKIRYVDPMTRQKRRLEFTREVYESYYRQSLPHSQLWEPGNNALCPFHNDADPSLSIDVNDGVWFCHACDDGGGIVDFEMRLHDCEDKRTAWERISRKLGVRLCAPSRGSITHRHAYRDEEGKVLYWVYRYEDGSARFLREVNGKRSAGLGNAKRTLYNLPQILTADTVLITEGEKKADVLSGLDLRDERGKCVAVTTTGAANSWKVDYADKLIGKRIIILPDTDGPGQRYADSISASFGRLEIRFTRVDFEYYGNDVRDFLLERTAGDLIELIDSDWLMTASDYRSREQPRVVILPGMRHYSISEDDEITL